MKGVMKTPVLTGLMNILATKPAQSGGRSAFPTPEIEVFAKLFEKLTQPAKPVAIKAQVFRPLAEIKSSSNSVLKPGSNSKILIPDVSGTEPDRPFRSKEPVLSVPTETLNGISPRLPQVAHIPVNLAEMPASTKATVKPTNVQVESKFAGQITSGFLPLPDKSIGLNPVKLATVKFAGGTEVTEKLQVIPPKATSTGGSPADNHAVRIVNPVATKVISPQTTETSRIEPGKAAAAPVQRASKSFSPPPEAVSLAPSRIESVIASPALTQVADKRDMPVPKSEFQASPKPIEGRVASPASSLANPAVEQQAVRPSTLLRPVAQPLHIDSPTGKVEPTYTRPSPSPIVTVTETLTKAVRPDIPEVATGSRISTASLSLETKPSTSPASTVKPKQQVHTPLVTATTKPLMIETPKAVNAPVQPTVTNERAFKTPERDGVVKPVPVSVPSVGLKTVAVMIPDSSGESKPQVETSQVTYTTKPLAVEPSKPINATVNPIVDMKRALVTPARDVVVKPVPVSIPSVGLKTVAVVIPEAQGDTTPQAQTSQVTSTTKPLAVESSKPINAPIKPIVTTERAFETTAREVVVKSNPVITTVPVPSTNGNPPTKAVVTTHPVEVVNDRPIIAKSESTNPNSDKSAGFTKTSLQPEALTTSEPAPVQLPLSETKRPESVVKRTPETPVFTNLRQESPALPNPRLAIEHRVERFAAVEAGRFTVRQSDTGMTTQIEPNAPLPVSLNGETRYVQPDILNPSQAMSNFIESRVIQQLHVAVKSNKASVPAESKAYPEALFTTIPTGLRSNLGIAKSESHSKPLPIPAPQPERKNGSERPASASVVSPFAVKQQVAESTKPEAAPTKRPQTANASKSTEKQDLGTVNSTIQPEARPTQIEAPPAKPVVPHPAPTTQPAIEMHELVSSIKNQTGANGSQKIELTLRPESLGKATALIEKVGEVLKLEFKVENAESQAAIESESSQLRESLASAGFHNVSLEFSFSTPSRSESDPQADPRQQHHRHQHDRQHEPADEGENRRERTMLTYGYNSFELTA